MGRTNGGAVRGRLPFRRARLIAGLGVVLALVAATAAPVRAESRPSSVSPTARAEATARAFVADARPDLTSGLRGGSLLLSGVVPLGGGDQVVRFQQVASGVPVYAGELAVQVGRDGSLLSMTGETSTRADGLTFTVPPAAAGPTALRAARARGDAPRDDVLVVGAPTAYVYDPVLVGEPDTGARPVWDVVVSGPQASGFAVEVLVDARTGAVAKVVDASEHLARSVCDNRNDSTSNLAQGSWCTASDYNGYYLTSINSSHPQAVKAWTDLAATSSFYGEVLGVDLTQLVGLDTVHPYSQRSAPVLTATVNYCEAGDECPYPNAFWVDANPAFKPGAGRVYPGGQIYLGQGLADSRDVVAHEITHGVTSAVNALKYLNQSGAINESMSDVFGQLTQLYDTNTKTFVTSRDPSWRIGENLDVPGLRGAVRSMSNPASTTLPAGDPQPDRMRSRLWWTSARDSGGVHANSGVGNKTAYLIARGGRFNGVTVRGIGDRATARIYWRTQNLLTSGASYRDLASTLAISCNALYGRDSRTCGSVRAATTATEIAKSRTKYTMASSSVRSGKARAIRAQLLSIRGGAFYVRPGQNTTLMLERRYLGSKKWHRVSVRSLGTSGKATWVVHPKKSSYYRVRYAGSLTLGLRGSSATHKLTVRR